MLPVQVTHPIDVIMPGLRTRNIFLAMMMLVLRLRMLIHGIP
jgi:hypothetical protein